MTASKGCLTSALDESLHCLLHIYNYRIEIHSVTNDFIDKYLNIQVERNFPCDSLKTPSNLITFALTRVLVKSQCYMDQVVLHAQKHILKPVMTNSLMAPKGSIATNDLAIRSPSNHTECNVYDPVCLNRQLYYCPRDIRVALLSSTTWIAPQNLGLGI